MRSVEELDAMSPSDAAEILRSCCGATRWVNEMVAMRPFRSTAGIHAAADEAWSRTSPADWLEAFSHHPRIGERKVEGWAKGEQAAASSASESTQQQLVDINRAYEEKFGHIYIICATGKSAEEMLDIARKRMNNDAESELHAAAEEQRKIMQLRLRKLLGENQ